jgi:hypothetical protein
VQVEVVADHGHALHRSNFAAFCDAVRDSA